MQDEIKKMHSIQRSLNNMYYINCPAELRPLRGFFYINKKPVLRKENGFDFYESVKLT